MEVLSKGRLINFLSICLTLFLILSTADAHWTSMDLGLKANLLVQCWCPFLTSTISHPIENNNWRYRRTRPSNGDAGKTNPVRPSALNQPWVILLIAGGGVLNLVCCLLNGLRCIHHLVSTRNEKQNARRRRTEPGANDNQQGDGDDGDELAIIGQSGLCQPPPYADIINDVVIPPPPYSAVYVGGAGWDAPPPSDDAELKDRWS